MGEHAALYRTDVELQLEFNPVILIDDSSDEELTPAEGQLDLVVPEVQDGHASMELVSTQAEAECHLDVMHDTAHMDLEMVTHDMAGMDASGQETEDDSLYELLLPISDAVANDKPQIPGIQSPEPARSWLPCSLCSRRSQPAPKRSA